MTSLINAALMRLTRRADANDPATLVQTFVKAGPLFDILQSRDHQIVYGRRGTGKTHALIYLAETVRDNNNLPIFIDMRQLGSTGGLYSDSSVSFTERGTRLLIDTLENIHGDLVDYALEASYSGKNAGQSLPLLDRLADQVSDVRVVGSLETERVVGVESDISDRAALGLSITQGIPTVKASEELQERDHRRAEYRLREKGSATFRIHFGAIAKTLSAVLNALSIDRLWLLLDEWSSVPLDLQPLLADLVRRSLFPINSVTVKIAAIEQRSKFEISLSHGDYLGMEIGADISADLDLDDFMVFGNDEDRAKTFFGELLHKHTHPILANMTVGPTSIPQAPHELVSQAFTQRNAFDELVKAAEGVPRDAINIVSIAAQRADDKLISVPHVRNAAKTWYSRDKESAATVNPEARALLHWIIDVVIGDRRAKAFMLQQGTDTEHPLIRSLYDDRVLHLVKKGVATHDQPGVRFNVYAIDYGCYVDLMLTARAPQGLLQIETEEGRVRYIDVPDEDYRSIRRAILDLRAFERAQASKMDSN
jgi:hypothetical protein